METRAWRVTGRVQGVGFRWWTRQEGRRLGLTGTVRNLIDGSVEVVARGGGGTLDRLEALLREGPTHARVESVVRLDPDAPSDEGHRVPEHGFHILR